MDCFNHYIKISLKNKNKMKKTINKKLGIAFGTFGLFIMMAFIVSAFGISTPYWDDNPLKLAPGESKIVTLGLQNNVGDIDVTLKAVLTNDAGGIATIIDESLEYFVPLGGSAVVSIKVEIAEDAVNTDPLREIALSFTQIGVEGKGVVTLAGGFTSKFPVEIVGFEESELYVEPVPKEKLFSANFLIILIILIAVVSAVIVFLNMRRNKK